jgi:hypothetical protein
MITYLIFRTKVNIYLFFLKIFTLYIFLFFLCKKKKKIVTIKDLCYEDKKNIGQLM